MRKKEISRINHWKCTKKLLLVMKLTTLLIFVTTLHLTATIYSQNTKINLKVANGTIADVFNEIERQSDFKVFYNVNQVDLEKKINYSAQSEPINSVLGNVLDKLGVTYELYDKVIVIIPTEYKQSQKVTGTVTDGSTGEPLVGVNVVVEGTTLGVVTDLDGRFSIEVPNESTTLVFSFVGYNSEKYTVTGTGTVDIKLIPDIKSLEEIVVVGYGTQRKSDVTGSVSVATAEDIRSVPSFNALAGLKGKASGVNIFTNSGAPGGTTRVIIRGIGTINSSSTPLYVVDGVVMENIQYLNPNDFERIEVLKDASSAAIYGARGANGVILITTKRGGEGKGVKVSYDGFVSISNPASKMDLLNAKEWIEVVETGYANAIKYGKTGTLTKNDPRLFDAQGNPLYDTDWQEEATRTAVSHNHQLSLQQGGETSSVGAFLNYTDMQGIILNSWMKRVNAKMAYDANPTKWLSAGTNILINRTWGNEAEETGGHQMPRRTMIEMPPIFPVKFPDGSWSNSFSSTDNFGLEAMANPVHVLETQERNRYRTQTFGNTYLTFHILPGLDLKTQLGIDYQVNRYENYSPKDLINISAPNGTASIDNNEFLYWQEETFLSYNKVAGKHRINSVLGLSWQERTYKRNYSSTEGFADDFYRYYNLGSATTPGAPTSEWRKWAMNSYFLRAAYTYNDKYLLTITSRVDGSSRFGDENKYGFFPSAGIGWIVSNEEFMKGLGFVDMFKLHTSYGITGNTEIGTYRALATVGSSTVLINGSRASSSYTNRLANPSLEWEKTSQFDIGFNLNMFSNRVSMEMSYYYKLTSDLLLDRPVPHSTGYSSVYDNIGEVSNRGIDFLLNTINVKAGDFTWETTLNVNYNKNKIEKLGENNEDIEPGPWWVSGSQIRLRVGESLSSYYGYERLGIWQENEAAAAAEVGAIPGQAKRSKEKKILGKGIPDYTGSFINKFNFRNWDLTADLQFVYGVDILQQFFHSAEDRTGYANGLSTILYEGWTPTNTNTMVQQIRSAPLTGQSSELDSHWVCDGSYLRGNLFQLGYTFSGNQVKNMKLSALRAYVSISNAFVLHSDDFKGYDPEGTSYDTDQWGQNMFFYQYPKPRTFTVGVNVSF